MNDEGMNRRAFLRTAGAGVAAVGTAGTAAAQEGEGGGGEGGGGGGGGGPIDYGGYLDDANGWEEGGTVDARGQSEVTIQVGVGEGGLAYEPVGVHVDPGTTIVWEWASGGHNVETEADAPVSYSTDIIGEGETREFQVPGDLNGVVPYFCSPHKQQGMLAALAVGQVPRKAAAAELPPVVGDGPRTLGVATSIAMLSTLGLAYFFMKYGGDYQVDE